MSYPPGQYPGQPYDPNAHDARNAQQAPGRQRSDPTMLNPMGQAGYQPPPDPTQLNPLSQPDPAYRPVPPSDPTVFNPLSQPDPAYQPVPPSDPTMFNPLSHPDPAYQQGQPNDPYAQQQAPQYPSVPQYQQAPMYQQAPQQFPPHQGGFPPGPPGQGFPPPHGPNGSGSGGGGGKVLAVIGSILLTVVVIAAIIGLKVWKNTVKHNRIDAGETTTSFTFSPSTSDAPTTRPSAKLPPPTTAPPTTAPTTKAAASVWIAAAYNDKTNEVHWATSSLSQDAAVGKAQSACGASCQEPIWSKDACVAFAFGRGGGWASAWGTTINEAQDKAVARAQGEWNVPGPFEFWSKCAKD
ncbi:DUF4189 domain-containing protein [Nocardia sp. NPDC046473]|uniref:DUF4189 domain-containing protein n=1 Tax=Nocardia sp. NPDC046473 TaxID=3155733 RepID=UPI0033D0599A